MPSSCNYCYIYAEVIWKKRFRDRKGFGWLHWLAISSRINSRRRFSLKSGLHGVIRRIRRTACFGTTDEGASQRVREFRNAHNVSTRPQRARNRTCKNIHLLNWLTKWILLTEPEFFWLYRWYQRGAELGRATVEDQNQARRRFPFIHPKCVWRLDILINKGFMNNKGVRLMLLIRKYPCERNGCKSEIDKNKSYGRQKKLLIQVRKIAVTNWEFVEMR